MKAQNKWNQINRTFLVVGALASIFILQGCGGGGGGGGGGNSATVAPKRIYMSADDGVKGYELYATDGTAGGTVLIKDINLNGSSNPRKLVEMNGFVYFCADDGVNSTASLWKTDGTASGTVFVSSVNPCTSSRDNMVSVPPVVIGNTFYFSGRTAAFGVELWKSDGTTNGTMMVKDINAGTTNGSPSSIVVMGGDLYFSANDNPSNTAANFELWKSDGSRGGTQLVKDINPGTANTSNLSNLLVIGQTIYFSAYHPSYGFEIWKSNGTLATTNLLLDINTSTLSGIPIGSNPGMLTRIGDKFYFTANDAAPVGNTVIFNGTQVWVSDGTTTTKLIDLTPPSGGGSSYPRNLTAVGNQLLFTGYTTATGTELWKSNGTIATTVMVKDINPGSGESQINGPENLFFAVNDTLYFSATDGMNGIELWKSDGSMTTTVLVRDINTTSVSANSDLGRGTFATNYPQYSIIGTTAYFTANNGVNGIELWRTDGSNNGTRLVTDINVGSSNGVNMIFK